MFKIYRISFICGHIYPQSNFTFRPETWLFIKESRVAYILFLPQGGDIRLFFLLHKAVCKTLANFKIPIFGHQTRRLKKKSRITYFCFAGNSYEDTLFTLMRIARFINLYCQIQYVSSTSGPVPSWKVWYSLGQRVLRYIDYRPSYRTKNKQKQIE